MANLRSASGVHLWQGIIIGFILSILVSAVIFEGQPNLLNEWFVVNIFLLLPFVPCGFLVAHLFRQAMKNMKRIPQVKFFIAGLSTFFTMVFFIEALMKWTVYNKFAHDGNTANGIVVETHPENHDTILVSYKVEDKTYTLQSAGPELARSYKKGANIIVYYRTTDPRESVLIKPVWQLSSVILSWIAIAILLPIILASQSNKLPIVKGDRHLFRRQPPP